MYCPNCATEISTGHRYCRGCGVDLQEVSQTLGGPKHIQKAPTADETKPRQSVEAGTRVWRRGFYCGIAGLVLVFLKAGIGMALIIVAIIMMIASYFFSDDMPAAAQSPPTRQLQDGFPVPSVTERTTNLFEGQRPDGSPTNSASDA